MWIIKSATRTSNLETDLELSENAFNLLKEWEGWNVQTKWNIMNISHRQQVEEDISQQQQNRNELHKCNSILCVCVCVCAQCVCVLNLQT
jgi:hypothetical protein